MKLKYYMRGLGIGILITTTVLSFNIKKEKLSDKEIIAKARELGMVMEEETDDKLEKVLEKSIDKENPEHIVADKDQNNQVIDNDNNTSDKGLNQEDNNSDTEEPVEEGNNNNIQGPAEDGNNNDTQGPAEEGNNNDIQGPAEEDIDNDIQGSLDQGNSIDNTNSDTKEPVITEPEDNEEIASQEENSSSDMISFEIVRGMSSRQVSELIMQKGLIEVATEFDDYIKQKGKAGVLRIGTYTLSNDANFQEILEAITD